MLIGFTYDLRDEYLKMGWTKEQVAEFDQKETIDIIAKTIESLGYEVELIGNAKSLIDKLSKNQKWDLVFNIAEGAHGMGREAQIPAILDIYQIPYCFADSATMAICLNKAYTKNIIRDNGLSTAPFFIANSSSDLLHCDLDFPVFVKPIGEGTSKGVSANSRVTNKENLCKEANSQLKKFNQPILIEQFLPGREFTVGILGSGSEAKVIGVLEIILLEGAESWSHSYFNKENCENFVEYKLVQDEKAMEAAELALKAWKILQGRDAGRIDIRNDAFGKPNFLEANPLSGLHPTHSDLPMLAKKVGIEYIDLISQIIKSALGRYQINDQKKTQRLLYG